MTTSVQGNPFGLVCIKEPISKIEIHAAQPAKIDTVIKTVNVLNKHSASLIFSYEELPEDWHLDKRFTVTAPSSTSSSTFTSPSSSSSYKTVFSRNQQSFTCEPTDQKFIEYLIGTACTSLYNKAKEQQIPPPFSDNPIFFMEYLQELFKKTRPEIDQYYLGLINFIKEAPIDDARLYAIAEKIKAQVSEENPPYKKDLALFSSYIALLAPNLNAHVIANKVEGIPLPGYCTIC